MMIRIFAICVCVGGCAGLQPRSTIPAPHPPPETGLVVFNVDLGRTHMPRLVFEGPQGPLRASLEQSGPAVVALPPGRWSAQLVGVAEDADRAHTGGLTGALERSFWPDEPIGFEVRPGYLTNGGTLCVHADCEAERAPFNHPALRAWRDAGRLLNPDGRGGSSSR